MTRIVIIGAGPAGLVSLAELIKQAKKKSLQSTFEVHIIEKRSLEFNRRQKLVNEVCNFGLFSNYSLINWSQYCKNLFDPDSYLFFANQKLHHHRDGELDLSSLTKPQKFLLKFYRQESSPEHPLLHKLFLSNFSIKELQLALLSHINAANQQNIHTHWHVQHHVTSINFKEKTLEIQGVNTEKSTIKFDHIINCEGSKGETIDLINQILPTAYGEKFEFQAFKFPTLCHAAVRIQLKLPEELNLYSAQEVDLSDEQLLKKFQNLSPSLKQLPNFYIADDNFYKIHFSGNHFEPRIFVACEIPQDIYNCIDPPEKKSLIIQWAILIASMKYKIPEKYFVFDDKGENEQHEINALTFKNELKFVSKAAIELPNHIKLFLVGDANMSNFYPAGYSSLLALNQAILAVQIICSNGSVEEYKEMQQYHRNYLNGKLNAMNKILDRDFTHEYNLQVMSYKK